jgi:multidrug resistance efflux pump
MLLLEREDLEQKLQAAEQRAVELERKLKETEHKLVAAEERVVAADHKAEVAEEKAARLEQTALVSERRTELAEEQVIELERKLYEAENDFEELLARDTGRMTLEPANGQSRSSSNGSIKILRNSCNSLSGYYMEQQGLVGGPQEEGEADRGAGDELSITSL